MSYTQINSLADFNEFINNNSLIYGSYILTTDIDLVGQTFATAVIDRGFNGHFDGANHTISNITINTAGVDTDYLGLFGVLNASISNLGIENIIITGGDGSNYLGGLCGKNNYGLITNCYAAVTVTGGNYLGGLCGVNEEGTITACYATGTVTGNRYLGGLCGENTGGTITDCYATSMVTGNDYLGGLCGFNNSWAEIKTCYAIGLVTGEADSLYVGGLCMGHYKSTITDCYFYIFSGPDNQFGTSLTSVQLADADSFDGFDFIDNPEDGNQDVWTIMPEHCPKLSWQTDDGPLSPTAPITTLTGNGSFDEPFQINSLADFDEFAVNSKLHNGYYVLTTDIDLAGRTFPAAVINRNFNGHFDGINHRISNFSIDTTGADTDYLGLFRRISASISNLGVENVTINGSVDSDYLGGLCGYNDEGIITNCYTTGAVTGDDYLGGLCGYNDEGMITTCYTTGAISGDDYLGGLCGYNDEGMITACYATGTVTGDGYLGGLCGCNTGSITVCYATGAVTGNGNLGGMCGRNSGSIMTCYAIGTVTGTGMDESGYLGGLCGRDSGSITACYFYFLSGPDNHAGTVLTSIQLTDAESFDGFDFIDNSEDGNQDNWDITTGHCPHLSWQTDDGPLPPTAPITTLTGSGHLDDPFEINSLTDFNEFTINSNLHSGYYILSTDIDLTGQTFTTAVINRYFGGHFDGKNHTISNLNIDTAGANINDLGLFNVIISSVSNLGVENVTIVGGDDSDRLGGLCGKNFGTITACYTTGAVTGGNDSNHLGGLCGISKFGAITASYSTCQVSGDWALGGLCGYNSAKLTNCYATGAVRGNYSLGGLFGIGSYNSVTASFWDTQTGYLGYSSGGVGKTTLEMQTQSTFTDAGWDFVVETANGEMDLWYMPTSDYPRLWWQYSPVQDTDFNGRVDLADLAKLSQEWLSQADCIPNYRLKCDINLDGHVDMFDISSLAENWLD